MATTKETQSEAENAEAAGEDGKAAAAKKKFSLKLILILVGGLVVLGGLGGGGYFFFGGHSKAGAAAEAGGPKVKPVVFLDMPDVLVNLSSSGAGDRTQYLKVKVTLELPNEAMSAQIQPIMPRSDGRVPNLFARIACHRSRRFSGAVSPQGRVDASRQRFDRAEPDQRRPVQGNRRPVTLRPPRETITV